MSARAQRSCQRICSPTLKEHDAATRINNIASVLRIASLPKGDDWRAALLIQYRWSKWQRALCTISDPLYCMIQETEKNSRRNSLHGSSISGPPATYAFLETKCLELEESVESFKLETRQLLSGIEAKLDVLLQRNVAPASSSRVSEEAAVQRAGTPQMDALGNALIVGAAPSAHGPKERYLV